MPSNYAAIRTENERRYGTDIGRIGQMLLADRYDERTHFIFELLQNAEDALRRRKEWSGSRAVVFELSENILQFSHCGKPFDDSDVRGICGIAQSTKDETAIGRFGIGFKSVYAYTTRPEIYSGDEAFAIDSFVWPTPIVNIPCHPDKTTISLPLNAGVDGAHLEILNGLRELGPTSLLFLKEIEEIEWKVVGGPAGFYLRNKPEILAPNLRRISVIGQQADASEVEQSWLIFHRSVAKGDGPIVGQIEIAFLTNQKDPTKCSIEAVANSPLVVFFPTVVPTHLGFLLQGPYKTTPSRDNVARNDPWNHHLVNETCSLIIESLHNLRDMGVLNTDSLRVLPLNRAWFSDGQMFTPVFDAVRTALQTEKLLPGSNTGHIAASHARLARSQELRELFTSRQLADVFGIKENLDWLSGDITQDRTPELRQYLMQELSVQEVTPETILARLEKAFLEAQSDEWIVRLYEFLKDRPALIRRIENVPLIRLTDGQHVCAKDGGKPQAFLPSEIKTGFPTVIPSVCRTKLAMEFLKALGLREPDPVDDVIINVLPKYRHSAGDVSDAEYIGDFERITNAFQSDSASQRNRLIETLRDSLVVKSVDADVGTKVMSKPGEVYLATERLKALFNGVPGVLLVDDSFECLRGEAVRDLLVACGASRYLRPIATPHAFTWQQLAEMRKTAGCEDCTYNIDIKDTTIQGLTNLLGIVAQVDNETAAKKATLLWEALVDVAERSGTGVYSGAYTWMYYQSRIHRFDAAFVRVLNETAWVPSTDGSLSLPAAVLFDSLNWKSDSFLQSKIRFKTPIIQQLAMEAGIDPGVLDLLKRLGVTNEFELRRRLGVEVEINNKPGPDANIDTAESYNSESNPQKPQNDIEEFNNEQEAVTSENHGISQDRGKAGPGEGAGAGGDESTRATEYAGGKSKSVIYENPTSEKRGISNQTFISYIGLDPQEAEHNRDPDGLDHEARMTLESKAIDLILSIEPTLRRTDTNNPGFDLYEADEDGRQIKWVEVKAMTESLDNRPVTMSQAQFDWAWKNGMAYWLYVVEYAGDEKKARILGVNDPAGKAKYFLFDKGWALIAQVVSKQSSTS